MTSDAMAGQGQPVGELEAEPRLAPGAGPGPGRLRARADALRAERTPFVQATVVRAIRPTSAKAGDRALVLPDGAIEGFVGGACAESSVRLESLRVLREGEPVVLRIIPEAAPSAEGEPSWPAPSSPTEPASSPAGTARAAAEGAALGAVERAEGDAAVLAESPAPRGTEGLVTVHNPCASGGMLEIFLEGVFPPPLIQVCGDAPIARAMAAVGAALGYDVAPAGPGAPVAPGAAAVVVASHGRDEEEVLTEALRAGVPYIGLVASRRRGAQVVAALEAPPADRERLHTPAGLDIGGRTPEEVALSIYAEIVAERRAPAAGHPGHRPAGGGSAGLEPAPAPDAGPEDVDPVCGMTVAVSPATPQLTHDGRMWYFCGPGCRQAFADDPGRYLA